jgi:hypothetical protein
MNVIHPTNQQLALWVGGDLDASESNQVLIHCQSCPHCQQLTADLSATREWLTSVAVDPAEEQVRSLRERVLASPRAPVRRLAFGTYLGLGFAAVLGILFALIVPVRLIQRPTDSRINVSKPDRENPSHAAERSPQLPVRAAVKPARRVNRELRSTPQVPSVDALSIVAGRGQPVLRIQTNDPNVLIYWLISESSKQELRNE